MHPGAEISGGHPSPPTDLKPLVEIGLVNREQNRKGGEHAEYDHLPHKALPVLLLERVVEPVAPLVDQYVEADGSEFHGDHSSEQRAAGDSVFGAEIGNGDPPHDCERRADFFHRSGSPGRGGCGGPKALKNRLYSAEGGLPRLKSWVSRSGYACPCLRLDPSMAQRRGVARLLISRCFERSSAAAELLGFNSHMAEARRNRARPLDPSTPAGRPTQAWGRTRNVQANSRSHRKSVRHLACCPDSGGGTVVHACWIAVVGLGRHTCRLADHACSRALGLGHAAR